MAIAIPKVALGAQTAAPHASPIDSRAAALVRAASDYLTKQPSYTFQADISSDDIMPPNFNVLYHAVAQAMVRLPTDLAFNYTGDRRQVNVFVNAKSLVLFDRAANVYATVPAASSLEATLMQVQQTYDFALPLSDFMRPNLYGALMSDVKTGYYVGPSTVAGVATTHLAFSQPDIDWQIWIQTGDQPLVRELNIVYKRLPGTPQYNATFTQWDFKRLADSVFAFTPPANAAAIQFLKPSSTETSSAPASTQASKK
jgi:hypothetical protein